MTGILYGVGVGPGAPDLVTVRAVAVLRRAPVIAAPRPAAGGTSLALRIARAAAGEVAGQETLELTFPMTRDPEARRTARAAAVEAIRSRLDDGKDVAFVTEGDPLVYSTFLDLLASSAAVDGRVVVVPGVSSITAVAAAARVPLADGDDALAVLPAPRALGDLPRLVAGFETLVLLKAGRHLAALRDALAAAGLLERAWVVAEASRPGERIARLADHVDVPPGYFTAVIVRTRAPEAR